jgi:hypothetical protein
VSGGLYIVAPHGRYLLGPIRLWTFALIQTSKPAEFQSLQPFHMHGFDLLARLLVGFLRKCRDDQNNGQYHPENPIEDRIAILPFVKQTFYGRALARDPGPSSFQNLATTGPSPNLYAMPARKSLIGTRLGPSAELVATLTKPEVARLV